MRVMGSRERKLKILLVEDNPRDVSWLEHMLETSRAYPVQIIPASDLRGALEHLDRDAPHCVLLDLSLPDSEGVDSVRHVVERDPKRTSERRRNRQKRTPFTGNDRVNYIQQTVYGEKPHEKEMNLDPFGQSIRYRKIVVKPLREECEYLNTKHSYSVNLVSPVDQQPAPDHHCE